MPPCPRAEYARRRRRGLSQATAPAGLLRGLWPKPGTILARRLLSAWRYMMTGALTPENGGSGEADVRNSWGQVQSPRERAAHYRKYAAQFRALAAGEQNESLRGNLM